MHANEHSVNNDDNIILQTCKFMLPLRELKLTTIYPSKCRDISVYLLIHWGRVTSDIKLDHHWFRSWRVALFSLMLAWTNVRQAVELPLIWNIGAHITEMDVIENIRETIHGKRNVGGVNVFELVVSTTPAYGLYRQNFCEHSKN